MQHPYGHGLVNTEPGLLPKMAWLTGRLLRGLNFYLLRPFDLLGLNRLRVMRMIWVKDAPAGQVTRYRVMHAAQSIDLTQSQGAEFLSSCCNYGAGILHLPETFVCEITPGLYYPELGLVANESFEVFADSVLLPPRFHNSLAYRRIRPWRMTGRVGPVSSIQRIDAYNFWHWMADCLPQVLTLEKYMNGEPLTLLAGDNLGGFQRQTLALIVPPTMSIEYVPAKSWIKTDRFVLPSYLSGRCNGYLPEDYYSEIRRRIGHGLGLDDCATPNLRIYVSRATAKRRRVANEAAVLRCLREYGFIEVKPETLDIAQQVSLFNRAEVIVAPHGAAIGGIVFAPRAKLLVLYPERRPGEYFYTMAQRIGVEHYGLVHEHVGEEDDVEDFNVDVDAMETMLVEKMHLHKREAMAA